MASAIFVKLQWLYREFGLKSLHDTGKDSWIIIFSRCTRMLAYGTNSLIMALFFSALDFSDEYIGLFMTLTLIGDVLLSLLLTLIADRVGRRRVLTAGSVLMVLSGATFALSDNFWALLFAAVVGVISATGSDFGPFRAIEESTLSHLTTPTTRSDVLSWYVTIASVGSAIGTEVSGRIVESLRARDGWELLDAYHAVFWLYCNEVSEKEPAEESEILLNEMGGHDSEDENEDDRMPASQPSQPETSQKKSMFATISKETRHIMYKLWFLLVVDSLADGMCPYSLTVYYMDRKFDNIRKSTLGDILSSAYILSSISTIFAGPLARRLGLINTMVFTHLPSSAAVLFFPVGQGIVLTVILFFLRAGFNNMDQAPRAAFIAAVVKPEERTAVMGITIGVHSAGVGRHWAELSIPYKIRNLKFQTGLQFLYPGAVTFPKLSILFLYLRIFTERSYRYSAFVICAILVINLVILWCFDFASCVPFSYQWNKFIPGHCIDQNALFTWISIPNLVTDVAILVLPLPVVYQLKCSKAQKLGVTITFLTASFGLITAIVRFVIFLTVPLAKDLSYYGGRVTIWTTVEPGVYLIAACLPSLRPLLGYFHVPIESIRSRYRATNGSSKPNSADIVLSPRPDSISGHRPGFPRPEDSLPTVAYEDEIDQRGLVSCYTSTTSLDEEVASSHGGDVGSAHGGDAASEQAVDQAVGEHGIGKDFR
ncbi:putative membrane protein [Lachnellula occidentalis]|uniref:Putative membrane protein n=1 Tax=Lachnellula occidentalis TaxID=215460 RepID=A0A8H8S0Z4_9HELO|nr:putative membrane protein [Lachnellula occidentalis]